MMPQQAVRGVRFDWGHPYGCDGVRLGVPVRAVPARTMSRSSTRRCPGAAGSGPAAAALPSSLSVRVHRAAEGGVKA